MSFLSRHLTVSVVTLLLLFASTSARADLIIEVGSAMVAEGQTYATLDVTIRSDVPVTGDALLNYGFVFHITPLVSNTVGFLNPQNDLELADSNYVFALHSVAIVNGLPIGTVNPFDTFTGGDSSTDVPTDIKPTLANPTGVFLLVRLEFDLATPTPPVALDQFLIELDSTDPNTFFYDGDFNLIPFTTTPGTLSITPSVVPEPASLAIAVQWIVIVSLAHRLRRRLIPGVS